MKFKGYEYYDNLSDKLNLLKIEDITHNAQIKGKASVDCTIGDLSFAYILDYIATLNQIMATSKKNGVDRQTNFIGVHTYEVLCKFFNQDKSKITVERLMHCFDLDTSYILPQNRRTFYYSFDVVKQQKLRESEMDCCFYGM